MAFDAESQAVLDALGPAAMVSFAGMTPEEARAALAARLSAFEAEPVHRIEDRTIPGPYGDIPIRVCIPEGDGPFGCLVWFHGGGWVVGSIETSHALCAAITNRAGCVTGSVGYRLAPEHKFPVPLDDCFTAVAWVADHAAELAVDADRVAVGGDSAGGNLAAAVCLFARDQGGPELCFQLLAYPICEPNFDTPSYLANGAGPLLSRDSMMWFWDHYLRTPADADNPYASPLRAPDLGGLPPAWVITAEYDPLRDEGERYGSRVRADGGDAEVRRYDGTFHGFLARSPVLSVGRRALDEVTTALRSALSRET